MRDVHISLYKIQTRKSDIIICVTKTISSTIIARHRKQIRKKDWKFCVCVWVNVFSIFDEASKKNEVWRKKINSNWRWQKLTRHTLFATHRRFLCICNKFFFIRSVHFHSATLIRFGVITPFLRTCSEQLIAVCAASCDHTHTSIWRRHWHRAVCIMYSARVIIIYHRITNTNISNNCCDPD